MPGLGCRKKNPECQVQITADYPTLASQAVIWTLFGLPLKITMNVSNLFDTFMKLPIISVNMEFLGRHSQIYGNHNVPIHVFI